MSNIKVPYNFVPFNPEKVYYPEWAKNISQDVPLPNPQSGNFTLKIEAHSPIFVRNGSLEKTDQFSQFNHNYFIPGSSVKGMLRNVLEILSYGKMSFYNDNRYAVRDLRNREIYMSRMLPQDNKTPKFIRCGWLYKEKDGKYYIEDCGEPERIKYQNIDKLFGTNMAKNFFRHNNKGEGWYDPTKDKTKCAKFKYQLYGDKVYGRDKMFTTHTFSWDGKQYQLNGDSFGAFEGTIVFTGQPGWRSEDPRGPRFNKGKGSDFIFKEPKKDAKLEVPDAVFKDFKFAYFDNDPNQVGYDWPFFKDRLKNGGKVPVFFIQNKFGLRHFGLSYLYKLPYDYEIGDYLDKQEEKRPDLAECIFGYVEDQIKEKGTAKGRVHVGHAWATRAESDQKIGEVLSSPRASFYPFYVQQNVEANSSVRRYDTYMDKNANLAGFKRYPIQHGDVLHNNPIIEKKEEKSLEEKKKEDSINQDSKIHTYFTPLKRGAAFSCPIAYHNLNLVELGALLSAITFHQTPGTYHALGMAKPLGYGKVKIKIEGLSEELQKQALIAYEEAMNAFVQSKRIGTSWADSSQVVELVTMSVEQTAKEKSSYEYMALTGFVDIKNNKQGLARYSNMTGVKIAKVNSLTKEAATFKANTVNKQDLIAQLNNLRKKYTDTMLEETKDLIRRASLARKAADGLNLTTAQSWGDIMLQTRTFLFAHYGVESGTALKQAAGSSNQLPPDYHPTLVEAIKRVWTALPNNRRNAFFDRNTLRVLAEFIGEQGAEDCKKSVTG